MTTLLKVGGSILNDGLSEEIINDLKNLSNKENFVIVHGGGNEVTSIAEKLGKKQQFIVSPKGIRSRYTDLETAEIFTMVMVGKLNKNIVLKLNKAGIKAVGLCGLDGLLLRAKRKHKLVIIDEKTNRKRAIEGGYTGKIHSINESLLTDLISSGYVPVISPVAMGENFEQLNIDADRTASFIGSKLKADRILYLTDVDGIEHNGGLIQTINLNTARELLPKMGYGMEKKLLSSLEALDSNVKEIIIASGLKNTPISEAFEHKNCTVILNE